MQKMISMAICLFLFVGIASVAQSVAINDDGSVAHPSAMLDIKVTTAAKKGLLIPRMTSVQRSAIGSPAKGLMVYDSTTNTFWFHNGTIWTQIAVGGANYWTAVGTSIRNTNSGNVGIGTTLPKAKLNVAEDRSVVFGKDSTSPGRKFIWYASKGALRFGTIDTLFSTTAWNFSNVGVNSLAFGASTVASGPQSIASGVASTASGFYAWAHGFAAFAYGDHSMAIGQNAGALGNNTFAFGNSTRAAGDFSQVFGYGNRTTGVFSAAFGNSTSARAYSSFVIGRYNDSVSSSSTTTWIASDPLFIIGNGSSVSVRSNAVTVLKNAQTGIAMKPSTAYGTLQIKSLSALKDNLTLVTSGGVNRWGVLAYNTTPHLYFSYNAAYKSYISYIDGSYNVVSDRSMKKDIVPMFRALDKVMQLNAYQYHYVDNNSNDPLTEGFIAQEVRQVLPQYVTSVPGDGGRTVLGLNYTRFAVLAIKAIQEQQVIINKQSITIGDQQKQINELSKRLDAVESKLK